MDATENTRENPLGLSKDDLETLFEKSFIESDKEASKYPPKPGLNESFSDSRSENFKPTKTLKGTKSSLRMKYEAETEIIKKTHGDLEAIRRHLGLSKRKMSQLLLVDPSAWTRWTSEGGEAPPHIYRALEWYLIMQDKHPEMRPHLWLNAVASPQLSEKELMNIRKSLFQDLKKDWEESLKQSTRQESVKIKQSPQSTSIKTDYSNMRREQVLEQKLRWTIGLCLALAMITLYFIVSR